MKTIRRDFLGLARSIRFSGFFRHSFEKVASWFFFKLTRALQISSLGRVSPVDFGRRSGIGLQEGNLIVHHYSPFS